MRLRSVCSALFGVRTNSGYGLTVNGSDSMVFPLRFRRAMKVTFCADSPSAGKKWQVCRDRVLDFPAGTVRVPGSALSVFSPEY
jgi:hypothetical protein